MTKKEVRARALDAIGSMALIITDGIEFNIDNEKDLVAVMDEIENQCKVLQDKAAKLWEQIKQKKINETGF